MPSARCSIPSVAAIAACVSALPAASTEFHTQVAGDFPLLWYRLNETTGTTIINHGSLGAAFNGITMNNPILDAPTPSGDTGIAFLQASQQWIQSASAAPASLTINPSYTIEAVVRIDPSSTGSNYAPILHWGTAQTGRGVFFGVWHNSANRVFTGFHNGGLRSVETYNLGCFHHLVWTRNSAGGMASSLEGSTLYVNGSPVDLEADDILIGFAVPNLASTVFRVQRSADLNRHFTGTVDEVVLYDHVLTHGEVVSHYVALGFDTVPNCPADLNHDGFVSGLDLAVMLAAWNNPAGGAVNPCLPTAAADLNCDCRVNGLDLATMLAAWGRCPPRT